jgi:hypothetical protein
LLHLELGAGQPSIRIKSGADVRFTHKYNAGVVYKNESDVETEAVDPPALTRVAVQDSKSNENFTSRPIVFVRRGTCRK